MNYEEEEKLRIAKAKEHENHRTEFSSLFHRWCYDCNVQYYSYEENGKDFREGKFSVLGIWGDGREQDPNMIKLAHIMASNIHFPCENKEKK